MQALSFKEQERRNQPISIINTEIFIGQQCDQHRSLSTSRGGTTRVSSELQGISSKTQLDATQWRMPSQRNQGINIRNHSNIPAPS
jgi:hypothetical protein